MVVRVARGVAEWSCGHAAELTRRRASRLGCEQQTEWPPTRPRASSQGKPVSGESVESGRALGRALRAGRGVPAEGGGYAHCARCLGVAPPGSPRRRRAPRREPAATERAEPPGRASAGRRVTRGCPEGRPEGVATVTPEGVQPQCRWGYPTLTGGEWSVALVGARKSSGRAVMAPRRAAYSPAPPCGCPRPPPAASVCGPHLSELLVGRERRALRQGRRGWARREDRRAWGHPLRARGAPPPVVWSSSRPARRRPRSAAAPAAEGGARGSEEAGQSTAV